MLQRLIIVLILLALLIVTQTELFSQSIYGPINPNYYREISKVGTQALQSSLISSSSYCIIGKNMVSGQQAYGRVVFQWNIPDNVIPNNSTITNVQLHFEYTKYNHSSEMDAQFSSLSIDNTNPTQAQLDQMWYEMSNTGIGTKTGVNNVINFTSNNSQDPFNIAIRDALVNDRFVLGVIASLPTYITDRIWNIQNPSVTLRIEYLPPTKDVVVDQKLLNNSSVDSIGLWNLTQNKFDKYSAPKTFTWNVNDTKTLQGSQKVLSNQKYNYWDGYSNVINHKTFTILPTTTELKSQFNSTQSGITIKNSLEGTGIDGGSVQFKDPWLIDYADPLFANTLRNRGMDNDGPDKLEFKTQTSPFIPDYTSSYNGYVYQGIFTGQAFNSGTYYSVGSLSEQTLL